MGWKVKFKAPKKLSLGRVAALVTNPVGAASTMAALAQKDLGRLAKANVGVFEGIASGNLGKSGAAIQEGVTTLGEMTGLMKRPGEMPAPGEGMQTAGLEQPSLTNITQDQNDEQRQRLGRKFASRTLFGGGGGSMVRSSSSGLLGL